jgi:hypothetical protein
MSGLFNHESKRRQQEAIARDENLLKELQEAARNLTSQDRRITVNKRTQRIRFENETEHSVTIIVEKK